MTTQQSGFIGPGGAESSQVLVKSLVKAAFRGEPIVPVFQAGLH